MRYTINLYFIYQFLFNKKFRILSLEKARLRKKTRYREGESTLLTRPLKYVDANTCYYGYLDIFEKEPYKFVAETENPYIIDCGANIGLSVIYFKTLYPGASIDAFEPDPGIFKVLTANVRNFGLDKVSLHQSAVWDRSGTVNFNQEGGMSGRITKPGDSNYASAAATRLKDWLDKPVDFLKIDIEGAEHAVLLDCAEKLGWVKNLFIEYHSHVSETQKLDEILKILTTSGFRYHLHEAYTVRHPYMEKGDMLGMDLQLNIYAVR